MEHRLHRVDRPLWVRIGLFGIASRTVALIWTRVSIVVAIGTAVTGFALSVTLMGPGLRGILFGATAAVALGVPCLGVALWYWLSMRWADEHEGWSGHL